MKDLDQLKNRLSELALKKSKPFCYTCYSVAPSGRCVKCGSDDLMRELAGNGVEWGVEWIFPILLRDALTPVSVEDAFDASVSECYAETVEVGWLKLDTVTVIKEMDPVSWRIARDEWVSLEESDGNIISFDNGLTYYWTHDVEWFLDESEEGAA